MLAGHYHRPVLFSVLSWHSLLRPPKSNYLSATMSRIHCPLHSTPPCSLQSHHQFSSFTTFAMFACSSVSEAERVQALIDRNASRKGKVDSVSKRHRVASTALSTPFTHPRYAPQTHKHRAHTTGVTLCALHNIVIIIHSFHPARRTNFKP